MDVRSQCRDCQGRSTGGPHSLVPSRPLRAACLQLTGCWRCRLCAHDAHGPQLGVCGVPGSVPDSCVHRLWLEQAKFQVRLAHSPQQADVEQMWAGRRAGTQPEQLGEIKNNSIPGDGAN
ncbi:hypothetical protein JZ751_020895 [Albula glossodonta]|uniref:Uncharacterized protein n=1 Tax=Albula glossodonta TaxID=121402 RepID=A0A8T2PLT9_9TELE|nr:hypothetical protein JZ751_020895 [Albula glossodonta]